MQINEAIPLYLEAVANQSYVERGLILDQRVLEEFHLMFGDKAAFQFKYSMLQDFMGHLWQLYDREGGRRELSQKLDQAQTVLRYLFHWIVVDHSIRYTHSEDGEPKYIQDNSLPFTRDEVQALLDNCAFPQEEKLAERRNRALILLLIDSGMWVSEVSRLKVEDVELSTGQIRIGDRQIEIGAACRKALGKYETAMLFHFGELDRTKSLFVSENGNPQEGSDMCAILNLLGERAGIENVDPVRFRRTYAVEYLRGGGEIQPLPRILGHPAFGFYFFEVLKHLEITRKDMAADHNKASPVENWHL